MKWDNINGNSCAPQNEPHTAKLSFSGVMKHFLRKLTKNISITSQKSLFQKEAKYYEESKKNFTTTLNREKS